jgi:hypothetical protein
MVLMRTSLILLLCSCEPTLLELNAKDASEETGDYFTDKDGDGFGLEDDCNDSDPLIHPEAEEVCDNRDNDCDGTIDQDASDASLWYQDQDGDGFGNGSSSSLACEQPSDHVEIGGDCDDNNSEINPDGEEVCDGLDNDCSGETDEDVCVDCLHYSYKSHTYQLCPSKLSWTEARDVCESWGYALSTIDNENEDEVMREWIIDNDFGSTWIGYNDRGESNEDDFSWVGAEGTDYEGWANGEPNDQGGDEDCVERRKGFDWQWNDLPCGATLAFVCEGNF